MPAGHSHTPKSIVTTNDAVVLIQSAGQQGLVPAALQLVFDLFELRPLSLRDGDALEEEAPAAGLGTDVREAQEVERLRFTQATPCSPLGREAAELQEACLVLVQCQSELGEPLPEIGEELLGVTEVLEPGHEVVGEADDDHVTVRLPRSPVLGPPVEDVMQVDVGQQRRG